MEPFGLYTLANDVVYDQLVALLNSIETNVSPDIPVCIIPFDDRLERVKQEIKSRPQARLFDDYASIARWEAFANEFARVHPEAMRTNRSHPRWYKGKLHRKFVAFDGYFEQFVFLDGDSLAMKPLTAVFQQLQTHDFVFDDWEHKKSRQIAALNIDLIAANGAYTEAEIRPKLHCSSFFGSKKGIFNPDELASLQKRLTDHHEAAWVRDQGWWDDAFLFNYMTLRADRSLFNFTLSSNAQDRTGNCANADPFIEVDHVLYNEQGMKPIHRLHYMGYSSTDFSRLCQGEAVDIRYKDVFLHYRFLKHPEQKPTIFQPPSFFTKFNRSLQRVTQKLVK